MRCSDGYLFEKQRAFWVDKSRGLLRGLDDLLGLPEAREVQEVRFLVVKELRCGSGLSRPGCMPWRGGLGSKLAFLGLPSFPACICGSCGSSGALGGEVCACGRLPLKRMAALSSPMRLRASSCHSRRRSLATASLT